MSEQYHNIRLPCRSAAHNTVVLVRFLGFFSFSLWDLSEFFSFDETVLIVDKSTEKKQ
jgi:hypothetical protein